MATVDGEQPHVRPLGFVMEYKENLAFYSDSRKNMYKQLKVNPKVELCAIDDKLNTLRLSGSVRFITDSDSKKAAFDTMPALEKMGYSVEDDCFEIYTLDNISFSLNTLSGKPIDDIEL